MLPKGFAVCGKAEKDRSDSRLDELVQAALQQIKDNQYGVEMLSRGVQMIVKIQRSFQRQKCGNRQR